MGISCSARPVVQRRPGRKDAGAPCAAMRRSARVADRAVRAASCCCNRRMLALTRPALRSQAVQDAVSEDVDRIIVHGKQSTVIDYGGMLLRPRLSRGTNQHLCKLRTQANAHNAVASALTRPTQASPRRAVSRQCPLCASRRAACSPAATTSHHRQRHHWQRQLFYRLWSQSTT